MRPSIKDCIVGKCRNSLNWINCKIEREKEWTESATSVAWPTACHVDLRRPPAFTIDVTCCGNLRACVPQHRLMPPLTNVNSTSFRLSINYCCLGPSLGWEPTSCVTAGSDINLSQQSAKNIAEKNDKWVEYVSFCFFYSLYRCIYSTCNHKSLTLSWDSINQCRWNRSSPWN